MAPRIRLCTFDVTNTLLKFSSSTGDEYSKVGRMYGVDRNPMEITKSFKHHWEDMNKKHPNYGLTTGLTSSDWWKEIVRRTFTHDCTELSPEQLNAISSHLFELYKSGCCWDVQQGSEKLLSKLKKSKLILGVISNFDERLDCVLKSTNLHCYFDFILASAVIGIAKPRKEIFELALRRAQLTDPSKAVHIGDNVQLDYMAAKNAGWNALLLSNKNAATDSLKDVDSKDIVHNARDIESFLIFHCE